METVSSRDIAPYEPFICERLTREITLADPSRLLAAQSPLSTSTQPALSSLLQEAATTIQFHAKWFTPTGLTTLLQTALGIASRSSSTADLYAALNLIDTIGTYSVLPTLPPAVSFISYCYYQGTRSNRHRRLTQYAWSVALHILESHLGGQFGGALLDTITDDDLLRSKFKLAACVGALMITTDKLLSKDEDEDANQQPSMHQPTMHPTQLLHGMRKAVAVETNHILSEQVTIMLASMLQSDSITAEIEVDGSWDQWIDLLERCIQGTGDRAALDRLFNGLQKSVSKFEARHQPRLAELFVEARRPLPEELSSQLLVPWQRALILQEDTVWTTGFRSVLGKLCDSTFYLKELDAFIDTSVSAFFQTENFVSRRDFVFTLRTLILDPGTAQPVIDILAKGIVKIFMYKTQKEKWEAQRNWLFPILCEIAEYNLEATQLLLRIRADEAGEGYLEPIATQDSHLTKPIRESNSSNSSSLYGLTSLSFDSWVDVIRDTIIGKCMRWDVYNAHLVLLADQIRNHALWRERYSHISILCHYLCDTLKQEDFIEPPKETGLGKSYVIEKLLQILTAMISYHSQLSRQTVKTAIVTIINVAGSREHTVSIHCVHALSICCFELPELMAGYMEVIISKMTRMVTQRNLALYVLEFLASLSRFSNLQNRLRRDDFKRIFGVCHSYLSSIRSSTALERKRTPTSEQSAGRSSSSSEDMAPYVYALTHHVITFWYMALKRDDRHGLKEYITSCLRYTDIDGKEHIEDQGLVTIDLMDRVDAEEGITAPSEKVFDESDGRIITRHRMTGLLLITTETSLRTGKTIVTIRRPSGTAQRTISTHRRHDSALAAGIEDRTASVTVESDLQDYITVFPDDITGRTYGKVAIPRPSSALGSIEILSLPEEDASVARAIHYFDFTPALDTHKAGIIYVGEEQTSEDEILLNQSGSPDYREFLEDMGSVRRLKGATFNTQGLDRADDNDGAYTIVWNNEVTELVYHVTTLMPSDAHDDKQTVINKKRHIGNDYVNIVFNNSGRPFRFDTFPSAFNRVYVVISPSERTSFVQAREITAAKDKKARFYNVHVLTRAGYPNLSSAGEVKVVSGACLGGYVRNLALNACVFSKMWEAGGEGEYPSSWRQRLQMIRRLYEQHRPKWAHE
ncbi:hypothetical protein M409DRAFT_28269 [Zasmidium cellare ATCC 36951]|uniref:Rap-GAP domain-containing protein n=1 Tax=Zasmidium cellare ATCC 36951 TaxID=1080233 RepID=A0A6A6C4X1_ZASCE|nr:uncharacterized protein M409DRAFT_28269 [Zasmidium cellare ATCC 36951]KAF2161230.1 hypothetical protein M409DRAFT_28269 [Zasmidium cellare ATCC 36951]